MFLNDQIFGWKTNLLPLNVSLMFSLTFTNLVEALIQSDFQVEDNTQATVQ